MILLDEAQARRLGLSDHKRTKFNAQHVQIDGYTFDSGLEADYYGTLLFRERAGEVAEIEVHPRYLIVDADDHGPDLYYEADFAFVERQSGGWEHVTVDVKSEATITPLFRLKARLFRARYPMVIFRVEVR